MIPILKKHAVTIISLVAIVVICIVWWVNGAQLEDAWLYVSSIVVVIIPAFEVYLKKKNKDQ